MTFYRFGVTFRHNINNITMNQFFFANQMFRDINFPKQSQNYEELRNYVSTNYLDAILEGFEGLWNRYQQEKLQREELEGR